MNKQSSLLMAVREKTYVGETVKHLNERALERLIIGYGWEGLREVRFL